MKHLDSLLMQHKITEVLDNKKTLEYKCLKRENPYQFVTDTKMDAYLYKQGRGVGKALTGIHQMKATQMEIPTACGLSKARLVYYFPFKQNLFVVIVDKYVFHPPSS